MQTGKSIINQIGELIIFSKRPSALSLSVQNQRSQMQRILESATQEDPQSSEKIQTTTVKKQKLEKKLPRCCLCYRRVVNSQSVEKRLDQITFKKQKIICQLCRSHNLLLTSKKILSELTY